MGGVTQALKDVRTGSRKQIRRSVRVTGSGWGLRKDPAFHLHSESEFSALVCALAWVFKSSCEAELDSASHTVRPLLLRDELGVRWGRPAAHCPLHLGAMPRPGLLPVHLAPGTCISTGLSVSFIKTILSSF